MSGDLKPNSHCNIKMTLTSARYPTNFEGEICCSIDWEDHKEDARSVATNTNIPETSEYLFIRLKKRSKIVSCLSKFLLKFYRQKCNLELTSARVSLWLKISLMKQCMISWKVMSLTNFWKIAPLPKPVSTLTLSLMRQNHQRRTCWNTNKMVICFFKKRCNNLLTNLQQYTWKN